ncbi:MAG: 50S ribosomal protein L17 [Pseudomonadota bacterium]
MKHRVAERKLGVKSAHRKAMLANLASSLVLHDRIETTVTRAKELRSLADKVVTLSKRGTVHAARQARELLRNRQAVQKAFGEFATRFEKRIGGYTRILKLGNRHGDAAPMAIIEYLDGVISTTAEETKTKGKAKAKKVAPKTSVKPKVKTKADEPKTVAKKKSAKKAKKD